MCFLFVSSSRRMPRLEISSDRSGELSRIINDHVEYKLDSSLGG